MGVRITLYPNARFAAIRPTYKHIQRIVSRTHTTAAATAPHETLTLANALAYRVRIVGMRVTGRAGVLHAQLYPLRSWSSYQRPSVAGVLIMQHKGHGPIRPNQAKALRFRPKGSPGVIDRYRTSGYPSNKFLLKAFKRHCPYPVIELPV